MTTIRDIRRKARRDLHQHMQIPAAYIPVTGTPVLVYIRDHTKFRANAIEGGVRSGTGSMVERQEMAPSIIFMRDELATAGVTLIKNGIISVETGEAYRLNNAEAPDDITVKWFVTAITQADELATFVVPDDFPLPE